jgi:hypothetical protein
VRVYPSETSYQMITRDMNCSDCPHSKCAEWGIGFNDFLIPEGTQISKVEMMTNSSDSRLIGLKFYGIDESVLLSVGHIDNPVYINLSAGYPRTLFTL